MNTILSSKLANSVQVTSPLAPLRKEHKIFTAIQPCSGWGYHHAMALSTTLDIVEAEYMAAHNDAMNARDAIANNINRLLVDNMGELPLSYISLSFKWPPATSLDFSFSNEPSAVNFSFRDMLLVIILLICSLDKYSILTPWITTRSDICIIPLTVNLMAVQPNLLIPWLTDIFKEKVLLMKWIIFFVKCSVLVILTSNFNLFFRQFRCCLNQMPFKFKNLRRLVLLLSKSRMNTFWEQKIFILIKFEEHAISRVNSVNYI